MNRVTDCIILRADFLLRTFCDNEDDEVIRVGFKKMLIFADQCGYNCIQMNER